MRPVFQKRMCLLGWLLMIVFLSGVSLIVAQSDSCPTFVEAALDAAAESCGALGRNQICYGNNAITAEFSETAGRFEVPGDRADVVDLMRLTTAPLAPDAQTWGVAMMALQADLPDVVVGQLVTFILFGNAAVEPDASAAGYDAPMQAFRLSTHFTGISCDDVPESGLLVQAPEATTVNFLINGVEVKVGSTAMLQMDGDDLTVNTIEGFVEITSAGATEVVGEGLSARVRRGQRPIRAAITHARQVERAPWRLLPRRLRVFPPPPQGQTVSLNDCFAPTARAAARSPVWVRAGESVVLRFAIPHDSLELARIIHQELTNTLRINGQAQRIYTRLGPWRGVRDEYGEGFGVEFYWLIEAPLAGDLRIDLSSRSNSGLPIETGVDGPDADRRPETLPAFRQINCLVRAR